MNKFNIDTFFKYEIINFIESFDIRNGEYEGNEYIVKKMDRQNFIIYVEYDNIENQRDIHSATAIYRNELINYIKEYAKLVKII